MRISRGLIPAFILFVVVATMPPMVTAQALQRPLGGFITRKTLSGGVLTESYDVKASCSIIEDISTFHFIDRDFIPSNQITALCEDKNGTIFIGTKDSGVIKLGTITGDRGVFNKFPVTDTKKHAQVAIHDLAYDNSSQRIYVATTGGLFYISDEDNFSSASCRSVEVFGDRTITALAISKNGSIWAGTSEGLFNWKGEHYTEANGLPCDRIRTLLFDKHDNLWVGTETGLAVRRGDTFHSIDFGDDEKHWVNDLALTKPLKMILSVEKYELIVNAFFSGIRLNDHYKTPDRGRIDATMQSLLNTARPKSEFIIVATSQGIYQIPPSSHKAEKTKEGWMNCVAFQETGLTYAANNLAEIVNLSPTTMDLARFNINSRFRRRMLGRMFQEVAKEASPALLDEATIEELYGRPEEQIRPELEARLQNLRATSLLIDSNNFFWLGLDGAGLFMADANMNTGDFFFKGIGPYKNKSSGQSIIGRKLRYYLTSNIENVQIESDDMMLGRAQYLNAWKTAQDIGFLPLKTWINKCSRLHNEDWNRIASYIGRAIPPKAIFEFISILGSDPYIFVPAIQNGDIPDLARAAGDNGMVNLDEEFIAAHEIYELPIIYTDPLNPMETYPANHPETRVNEAPREIPVEFRAPAN